jgi:hypothetical protein
MCLCSLSVGLSSSFQERVAPQHHVLQLYSPVLTHLEQTLGLLSNPDPSSSLCHLRAVTPIPVTTTNQNHATIVNSLGSPICVLDLRDYPPGQPSVQYILPQ